MFRLKPTFVTSSVTYCSLTKDCNKCFLIDLVIADTDTSWGGRCGGVHVLSLPLAAPVPAPPPPPVMLWVCSLEWSDATLCFDVKELVTGRWRLLVFSWRIKIVKQLQSLTPALWPSPLFHNWRRRGRIETALLTQFNLVQSSL